MTYFFKRLLQILGQVLAIVLPLMLLIGIFKQKDAIYTPKRYLFEQHKQEVECIILGNSHSNWGIIPGLFPCKTINLGEVGKPIDVDIEMIEKNIGQLPHLKYVIIPVDYFTFYFRGMNESSAIKYYHHWNLHSGSVNGFYLRKYHIFTCGFSLFETVKKYSNDSLLGYFPQYAQFSRLTKKEKQADCKDRIRKWDLYLNGSLDSQYLYNRLNSVTTLLQSKKVTPIFVTLPVTQEFYQYFNPVFIAGNARLLQKVIAAGNCKYLNLQASALFNQDSLFNDPDHLNNNGAIQATTLIKNFLTDSRQPAQLSGF